MSIQICIPTEWLLKVWDESAFSIRCIINLSVMEKICKCQEAKDWIDKY